jgi:DNA-binding FadR family transcriptional regulator
MNANVTTDDLDAAKKLLEKVYDLRVKTQTAKDAADKANAASIDSHNAAMEAERAEDDANQKFDDAFHELIAFMDQLGLKEDGKPNT